MPKSYPLECKSIATSNNMKLVHWPVLHLVQRGEDWVGTRKQGTGGAAASPSPPPHFAVPNVTVYPSTASVPITVLL